jgi:hypothetical protein
MDDACYLCRRTQADLDRLNEETRTRVYLTYFTNARSQIDDLRRRISFLQRLKDEEGGDPHFRINAKQVLADPPAYKKMMPWIETLVEIAHSVELPADDGRAMSDLVGALLAKEHRTASALEDSVNQLRSGFASGERSPLTLELVKLTIPISWTVDRSVIPWKGDSSSEPEPIRDSPEGRGRSVDLPIHLCTLCKKLAGISTSSPPRSV